MTFLIHYNDVRAFEVFERTGGSIFRCETAKKLAKSIKKNGFFSKHFLYNVLFFQILTIFKFSKISYVPL